MTLGFGFGDGAEDARLEDADPWWLCIFVCVSEVHEYVCSVRSFCQSSKFQSPRSKVQGPKVEHRFGENLELLQCKACHAISCYSCHLIIQGDKHE